VVAEGDRVGVGQLELRIHLTRLLASLAATLPFQGRDETHTCKYFSFTLRSAASASDVPVHTT